MKKRLLSAAWIGCALLAGCGKDNNGPAPQPEKETWQQLPDSLIRLDVRNIRASYADSQHLMLFAYNGSYIFDSSFSLQSSYGYLFNSPGYLSNNLVYKAGPHFRIFKEQQDYGIMITANEHPSSGSLTYLPVMELGGTQGAIGDFSAPDDQDNFYAAVTVSPEPGIKSFVLYKYHMVDEQHMSVSKSLLWKTTLFSGAASPEDRVLAVNTAGDVAFVTASGMTYRVENGIVTDSTVISLRSMTRFRQFYVATCVYRATAQQEYPTGLVYSSDEGRSWQYIGTGDSFGAGQLVTIGDQLFLNTNNQLALIDFESGAITPLLHAADVNGYIRTVNLFHNKVYIGTDAGVYYKSLEGFMHP